MSAAIIGAASARPWVGNRTGAAAQVLTALNTVSAVLSESAQDAPTKEAHPAQSLARKIKILLFLLALFAIPTD